jgi:hypothetical protein
MTHALEGKGDVFDQAMDREFGVLRENGWVDARRNKLQQCSLMTEILAP